MTANSNDPYQLLVESTTAGFFNRQKRDTYRTEWKETYQFGARNLFGTHQLKAGIDFAHSDYDGRVGSLPVSIIGVSIFQSSASIFGPMARLNVHQNEASWFLADKWTPLQRLNVDPGVRFDRDSLTHSTNAAPRADFALMLTRDAKTLLKGAVGFFTTECR